MRQYVKIFLATIFSILLIGAFGQEYDDLYYTKEDRKKKKKKVEIKTHAEEVADFRKRMEKLQQEKAKAAEESNKPQYTNPLYFGHKKPPKKRPNGKKKFCKE